MTDKEIKKLSKTELLWIIHDQEEEIIELKSLVEELNTKIKQINIGNAECDIQEIWRGNK